MRKRLPYAVLPLAAAACLAACGGGSKLVRHPAQDAATLLRAPAAAQAEDGTLRATFHVLVVRNGAGSWAKNADWDEAYLQVTNLGTSPLALTGAAIVDSRGTRLPAMDERKDLKRASRDSARRYRKDGIKVTSGAGGVGMAVTGTVVAVAGYGTAVAATTSSLMGGTAAGAGAAAGAMLIAGPAMAIVGIVRAVHNSQVNAELGRRAPHWPVELAPGQTASLDLFVPLAPSPQRIELDYTAGGSAHQLQVDVRAPLAGLHFPPRAGAAPPR